MNRYVSLFLFLLVLFSGVKAQSVTDYRLLFDKCGMGSGVLKVQCDFTIDFAGCDSVVLDFGGNFEELSVEELTVMPDTLRYRFDPLSKQIFFSRVFHGSNDEPTCHRSGVLPQIFS